MRTPLVAKHLLLEHLHHSLDEAQAHARLHSEAPDLAVSLTSRAAPRGMKVQAAIFWRNSPHPVVSRQLWDRIESVTLTLRELDDLHEALEALCAAQEVDLVPGDGWHGDDVEQPLPSLYRYHPCRTRALRSYGERLAAAGVHAEGAITDALVQTCRNVIWQEEQEALRNPLRYRLRSSRHKGRTLLRYADGMLAFACYSAAGCQLYDFAPALTEHLRATDSDNIHLDDIRLPHPALYMHFGRQSDLHLGGTWVPEGAYVRENWSGEGKRQLVLTFAAAPGEPETYLDFDLQVEPVFQVSLETGSERRSLRRVFISRLLNVIDEMDKAASREGLTLLAPETLRSAREEKGMLIAWRKAYAEMVNLALNAMAYVSMYPQNIQPGWSAGAPEALVDAATNASSPRARVKARQELGDLGFCTVYACRADGLRLSSDDSLSACLFSERGHWAGADAQQAQDATLTWVPPVRETSLGRQREELAQVYPFIAYHFRLRGGSGGARTS